MFFVVTVFCFNVFSKKGEVKSLNNSVIAFCDVIKKIFSVNYNDEFYHVVCCYLENGITIF